MRILVIEDEPELREDLAEGLRFSDYAVDTAEDGQKGLELLMCNAYDLLILDLNLPVISGMEVLRRVRQENHDLRILILSARDAVEDRVDGLDEGANDYLVKPFHFNELLARIRSLLRRRFETESAVLTCGKIALNRNTGEVWADGITLNLRPKEYGMLLYLMEHADRYITQEELFEHVWDDRADPFTASVRVYMSYLRKKLAACMTDEVILSAPTRGYMIRKDPQR